MTALRQLIAAIPGPRPSEVLVGLQRREPAACGRPVGDNANTNSKRRVQAPV